MIMVINMYVNLFLTLEFFFSLFESQIYVFCYTEEDNTLTGERLVLFTFSRPKFLIWPNCISFFSSVGHFVDIMSWSEFTIKKYFGFVHKWWLVRFYLIFQSFYIFQCFSETCVNLISYWNIKQSAVTPILKNVKNITKNIYTVFSTFLVP